MLIRPRRFYSHHTSCNSGPAEGHALKWGLRSWHLVLLNLESKFILPTILVYGTKTEKPEESLEDLSKRPTKGTKVWLLLMAFWTQPRLWWDSYLQGLCQVIMWQPIIYLKSAWKDRWPVILGWLLGLTWILLKLNLPDDLYWRRTKLNKEFDSCPFTTWPEGQGLGFGEHLNRERANYISRWLIQKIVGSTD